MPFVPSVITEKDLRYVADLARIKLSEEEVAKYTQDLSAIVDFAAMLQEVDVTDIEPMYTPILDKGTPKRADSVITRLSQEEALKASKEVENGHFLVPRTVE